MTETPENRRPLKSRGTGWAQGLASGLAKAGASPDMISAGSIIFALLGLLAFLYAAGDRPPFHRGALLIGAGVCIQLRLLCNLLDGMVAVEHGELVSASIVTRFEGSPFVAFTMTQASHKGRGLSRAMMTRTVRILAEAGASHLDLVVTAGNEPAQRLYSSLGFVTVETFES